MVDTNVLVYAPLPEAADLYVVSFADPGPVSLAELAAVSFGELTAVL